MAKRQIFIELGVLVVVLTIGALCVYTINKNGVPGPKLSPCERDCLPDFGVIVNGKCECRPAYDPTQPPPIDAVK